MIIYCVVSDEPRGYWRHDGTKEYHSSYQSALVDYEERMKANLHTFVSLDKLIVSRFSTIDLLNRRGFVETRKVIKEWREQK